MSDASRVAPRRPMPTRYRVACAIGAAAASIVFLYVLSAGHASLAPERAGSGFYASQARALLDGHWDIPPDELGIEAFEVGGKSYTYFGPVPAVLRMPVMVVTDGFDGRLTQPSMALAFAVAMVATSMLFWRIRSSLRDDRPVGPRELAATGVMIFFIGAGTIVLYLASQAVVYHEAILWGLAFSLCSYLQQIELLARPSRRALGLAGTFAGLALLTRASVGAGPVASLALLAVVMVVVRLLRRQRPAGRTLRFLEALTPLPPPRYLAGVVIAVAVPVAAYSAINYAKFDHPWRLPLDKQVFSDLSEERQAALEANGGSLFGFRYVPTTFGQYARPDAVELDSLAPWLNFPRRTPTIVGDVQFDTLDESSSASATMPLLIVLGVVGAAVLIRPRRRDEDIRAVRLPVLGAAAGAVTVLTIAFVANRYLGDLFPVLLLPAVVGFHWSLRRLARASTPMRSVVVGGAALLGLWGVTANSALAIEYQRLIAPADPADRVAFVEWQYELDGTTAVRRVDETPRVGPRGAIAIVGDCDELLWSDGYSWSRLDGSLCETLDRRLSEG